MPKKQSTKKTDIGQSFLRGFYEDALKEGIILRPDEAINKLKEAMTKYIEFEKLNLSSFKREHPRLDLEAEARRLHHYAVDLFYDTYFGKKVGAPPLDEEYLEHILQLSEKGLSYGQIARELKLPTSPPSELAKSTDRIRQQLKIAKKKLKS